MGLAFAAFGYGLAVATGWILREALDHAIRRRRSEALLRESIAEHKLPPMPSAADNAAQPRVDGRRDRQRPS